MDEQLVPIDIHYKKLLDWLIDRNHCDVRWHRQLKDVRAKVIEYIMLLPKNDAQLQIMLDKQDLCYYDCCDVMEYLLTVESPDQNFLGQYTSPTLKKWDEILQLYKKKNLYLAEGAQIMSQLVDHDIASLKRQINHCQQQQREHTRKITDNQNNANSSQMKYNDLCQEFEIEGKDVHSELIELVAVQLPTIFSEIVVLIKSLGPVVHYYQLFRSRTISNLADGLELLKYVMENGNTTVYQYKNGEVPSTVDEIKIEPTNIKDNVGELVIDWGEFDDTNDVTSPMDYEIDFTIEEISDITLEDGGMSDPLTSCLLSKYPTILEDYKTRNALLDDLMELLEFVKQRVADSSSEGGNVLAVELPSEVQGYSSDEVNGMVEMVSRVVDKMIDSRTQKLLLMLGSQSYLERITSQFAYQKEICQKASLLAVDHTQKLKEVIQDQEKLEKQVKIMIKTTNNMKHLVASDISKKYNNRTVNITGAINQL